MNAVASRERPVFPALLKFWRNRRGLSQIDLGLAADVSAKHLSFLETGRSGPSREMVLLLAGVLDVSMRDTNQLLRSAGFGAEFPEPDVNEVLSGPLGDAITAMFDHHEPYPMILFDRLYNVVRSNGAGLLLAAQILGPDAEAASLNVARVLFGKGPGTSPVLNWDESARTILQRLHRQALHAPSDVELQQLLEDLQAHPAVPPEWRSPELAAADDLPVLPIRLRLADGAALSFLTTVTTFNAPLNVTLADLHVEAFFALDADTRDYCRAAFSS